MLNVTLLALDTYFQLVPSIWIFFVWIVFEGLLGGLAYGDGSLQRALLSVRRSGGGGLTLLWLLCAVNTFALIAGHTRPEQREFAMSVSIAGMPLSIALVRSGAFQGRGRPPHP
jgi:hypothetical protein